MGRRAYLHIGTMKSATSYLGQLCELNNEYLSEHGLYWPMEGLRYTAVRDFFGRQVREVDFTGCWRQLVREMAGFHGDVLLSNEMLAPLTLRQIKRLTRALSEYELYVVVTARDPARVIPSHWQTTLKNGKTQSWCDFAAAVCADEQPATSSADHDAGDDDDDAQDVGDSTHAWFWRRHDVAAILQRWSQYVPIERTAVVTVPPSGSDPSLVAARFGSVIGLDISGLEQPEWINPSLGAHSAELLRRLNLQMQGLTPAERSYGARGALAGSLALNRAQHEPRFGLTPAQQDWTRARALAMVEALETSGVRVVGDLTDLLPAEQPPTGCVDPEDATAEELLRAASHGIEGMVRAYTEVRLEKRELTQQVESLERQQRHLQERIERQRGRVDTLLAETSRPAGVATRLRRRFRAALRRSPRVRRWARRLGLRPPPPQREDVRRR